MSIRDPYEPDLGEIERIYSENKSMSNGVICPERNISIRKEGKSCAVCGYILNSIYNKGYPDDHQARIWARQKKAKASVYMNVLSSDDKNNPKIMKLGSKVVSEIIENLKARKKGWVDILKPKANEGVMLTFSKGKSGAFNRYGVQLDMDRPDWDVPTEVLNNLPNLDQDVVIGMIRNNQFTSENYIDISSLKDDETLYVRVLPPWTSGSEGDKNKRFFQFVWRHWGISEAQIAGTEPLSWKEDGSPIDEDEVKPETPEPLPFEPDKLGTKPKVQKSRVLKPECFGDPEYYDPDEATCKKCSVKAECESEATK